MLRGFDLLFCLKRPTLLLLLLSTFPDLILPLLFDVCFDDWGNTSTVAAGYSSICSIIWNLPPLFESWLLSRAYIFKILCDAAFDKESRLFCVPTVSYEDLTIVKLFELFFLHSICSLGFLFFVVYKGLIRLRNLRFDFDLDLDCEFEFFIWRPQYPGLTWKMLYISLKVLILC